MRQRARLTEVLQRWQGFEVALEEAEAWATLARSDSDALDVAETEFRTLAHGVRKAQLESLLCGEKDVSNCYLELHAGAGGVEAQDWASMLVRMYVRWAERRDFSTTLLHESPGEEAGIKSASMKIEGTHAYGWLKTEAGIHRLVRISPFDAGARRHTSFASVGVCPEVAEKVGVDIQDKDLRIDTYRASGAGGQHVNKTDSAVRLTYLPKGIVVQCQSHRSQHRNRAQAMEMLRARLYALAVREREEKNASDPKHDIGWGHQIRSYVLQPYRVVKDIRTGLEKPNPDAVLDGDLDDFLEASLSQLEDSPPQPAT